MRRDGWLCIGCLVFAASCAHDPSNKPLTPEEKARMIEAVQAREAVSEEGKNTVAPRTGCSNSNPMSRFNARGTGFSGADGFDTRGCNAVGN